MRSTRTTSERAQGPDRFDAFRTASEECGPDALVVHPRHKKTHIQRGCVTA